jgi:hypothetical protein
MNLPAPNHTPDLSEVIRMAELWVNTRIVGQLSCETESMIFGPLMQAIYGPDIFSRLDTLALPGKVK